MSDTRNLPKRFYETVTVVPEADGYAVRLDARALKTPGRRSLAVPREAIAAAVASEWSGQGEFVDPATMPVTRLVNTTLDGIVDDPAPVRSELKRYVESDLLFYRAEGPERLVERQAREWDPVLHWAEGHVGGLFAVGSGIMYVAQPAETLQAYGRRLDREADPFALAGLHQMTTLTGSSILALAVLERRLAVEECWRLAHLDEDWNVEQWGADDEATRRRQHRFDDMKAAALLTER